MVTTVAIARARMRRTEADLGEDLIGEGSLHRGGVSAKG
jgi:hypothetical protein